MTILQKFRRRPRSATKPSVPGPIGIDIGDERIHLCQVRPLEHGRYSIFAKDSVDYAGGRERLLAEPKRLRRLLGDALRRKRFKGRRAVALMPWEDVRIMLLTYKANVGDVDGEVVKMLAGRVDGSIESYVVDYVPVRANVSDEEHMVVATVARRERVDRLLNALIACGLEIDALDIGPTALRRLVGALYTGPAADNVLLIHSYPRESYVTVISGRRLLFNQSVAFGETPLLERIMRELDVTAESARALVIEHGLEKRSLARAIGADGETDVSATLLEIVKPCFIDLVEEINRVLVFTAAETHGVPVSRVCLLGCLARWPGAQNILLSLLDIEQPEGQIEFNQIFEDDNDETRMSWEGLFSDISISMGLALRGLIDDE